MNILLITSIYPIPEVKITGSTSVCHYFAKEWQREGHNVLVVNTYTQYTPLFHWLGRVFNKAIMNKFPVSINTTRFAKPMEYELDGVGVMLSATYKFMPKMSFSKRSIKRTARNIERFIAAKGFRPDIVTTHFLHPNLELLAELKAGMPEVPMGICLHGKITDSKQIEEIKKSRSMIDFWGFRSVPIQRYFLKNCFTPTNQLFCFSGVPESYVKDGSWKKHNASGVVKYLFVGNLIHRKHPLTLIESLENSGVNYELEFVGDGAQRVAIEKYAHEHGCQGKVLFHGRLPREEVARKMEQSECFVMVSEDETFGLVYLEAMANGCLVVASEDEGMDGIIRHGENGFLCKAGDSESLSRLLKEINNLPAEEKMRIAKNAIETANRMTDEAEALRYANSLREIARR